MSEIIWEEDERIIASTQKNEDAAVLIFPPGQALIQTLDFFTPIVNDPFSFGQIAAANSLSDVYAMGGQPYAAMNIVCFPSKCLSFEVLKEILKGGLSKIKESGAVMAGGHSVDDDEIKYGLSVAGIIEPDKCALNNGLKPGDQLLLTKPLGTGILATAIKANWPDHEEMEDILLKWCGRLNDVGARIIRDIGIKGATDVTGFGLGGHILEMAKAAQLKIDLFSDKLPIMDHALDCAGMGLVPAGSYANKNYYQDLTEIDEQVDDLLVDIIFDAQTSGGLILAVDKRDVDRAKADLELGGDLAAHIGEVSKVQDDQTLLRII